jgi:hypothetical protein
MSTPHSGAPPGPDVTRGALGREAPRGSAVAVGAANSTTPPLNTQPLALPAGAFRLLQKRYSGFSPIDSLCVATDKNIGKAWSWRIMVEPGDDPDVFDFHSGRWS